MHDIRDTITLNDGAQSDSDDEERDEWSRDDVLARAIILLNIQRLDIFGDGQTQPDVEQMRAGAIWRALEERFRKV